MEESHQGEKGPASVSKRPSAKTIGRLQKVTFKSPNTNAFFKELRARVQDYFEANKISKYANRHMLLKTTFYIGGWLSIYLLVLSGLLPDLVMLGLMILLGFFLTGIGFNIGHDALHGAYSSNAWINRLLGASFPFIGANAYTWKIRHNVIHHTYSNIIGSDGDLESTPLMRFCLQPGRRWFHRYQHWYAPVLYCFVTLVWVFKKDYVHIFEERREQRLNRKPPVMAYISLLCCKSLHILLFLVLPIMVFDIEIWKVMVGFLSMHMAAGLMMATVFQLGHIVEKTHFVEQPAGGIVNESWAEHQLRASANFGTHPLTTWICGGLNYQIEHHLFPGVCHVHYPALSEIVKSTAQAYNLPYNAYSSFWEGLRSHFRLMKYFGRTD